MSYEFDTAANPMHAFRDWLALAEKSEPNDPNAAALATASSAGVPSVRMVLVKGSDDRGLWFFTNADSQKGSELRENPVAAVCFHWKSLRRQVRFAGEVRVLDGEAIERYFHSRSRASQIAAAVSKQSRPLDTRAELESAFREYTSSHAGEPIPLPAEWTGFLLVPSSIEFWVDGLDRLHDRMLYKRSGQGWIAQRLYP